MRIHLLSLAAFLLAAFARPTSAQAEPATPAALPGPLTLAQARELALAVHPRVASARLRELATREAARASTAAWYPSLTGNATLVGTDGDENRIAAGGGLNNPIIYDRGALGLNVSWQLYDFGRTAHRVEAARLRIRAMAEGVQATRADVVLHVDEAFLAVLQAVAAQRVVQQAVSARSTLRDRVKAMVTNALRSELDLAFAESALAEASLLLSRTINDEASARARLGILLGIRGEFTAPLDEPPWPREESADAATWIRRALATRPELKRARLEHEVALRQARVEQAGYYPVLTALGAGGVIPLRHERLAENYLAGGLNLSVPLFDGFRTEGRRREADLLAAAAGQTVQAEEGRVIREVRIAVLDLANAHERLRLSRTFRDTAGKAVRLAELKSAAGTVSVAETAQAQLQATAAEVGEVSAHYGVLRAWSELQFESGTLLAEAP